MQQSFSGEDSILRYKGPMTIHVRTFFANFLKVLVDNDYKTSNRLFKIFIELTQNVAYYSAHRQDVDTQSVGVGEFVLNEYEKSFNFTTINLILPDHGPKLIDYCKEINRLDVLGLRELKRKKRKLAGVMDVGAHIGLIHIGILSENALDYDVLKENDDFFRFRITASINKC
ncbi:MAG: DUF6272 family protein [Bacteroidota bacterium]